MGTFERRAPMRALLVVALLIACIGVMPGSAGAAVLSETEPNDSAAEANALPADGTWMDAEYTTADYDWYSVAVTGGKTYLFETGYSSASPGTFNDTYLFLYESDGSTLIDSDDDGRGFGNFSLIVYTPPADTTLYLRSRSFSYPNGQAPYAIHAVEAPPMFSGVSTSRVSVGSDGSEQGHGSRSPDISADGRYVVYATGNSWDASDTNDDVDIYRRDTRTGAVECVSVDPDGNATGNIANGDTDNAPAISADGRYVAFDSWSDDVVSDDENGYRDVFVRDMVTGVTTRVSVSRDGVEGNYGSQAPDISGDGRVVAFATGNDWDPNDTNGNDVDYYVRNLRTGELRCVSVDPDGEAQGDVSDGSSTNNPSLSSDGRYVAFDSWSDYLTADDDNSVRDVFVRDMVTGITQRASVNSDEREGDRGSKDPAISGDGRYVAFITGNDWAGADDNGYRDIYVRDTQAGTIAWASCRSDGDPGDDDCEAPAISADGRFVTFWSGSSELVLGDENGDDDVFLHGMASGHTGIISSAPGNVGGNDDSEESAISSDGRYVAFDSWADNFVADDENGVRDVFVAVADNTAPVTAFSRAGNLIQLTATDPDGADCTLYYGLTTPLTGHSDVAVDGPQAEFSVQDVGNYTLTFYGVDVFGNTETQQTVEFSVLPPRAAMVPIQGTDRFGTAVALSQASWPQGAGTVVIATGDNWPDALGGSALAGAAQGPVLLVHRDSVPAAVMAEVTRLGAGQAYVLGDTGAVGSPVISALSAKLGSSNVRRLGGADRFETAELVAAETVRLLGAGYDGKCFVATGDGFADALSASPLSFANRWPVYLTAPGSLNAGTGRAMREAGVNGCILLGGEAAVGSSVASSLRGLGFTTTRLAGADRYATAAQVAAYGVSNSGLAWDGVGIATGEDYPDALAGGPGLGKMGSVMLLTQGSALPGPTSDSLTGNKSAIDSVRFLGGTAAISQSVRDQIAYVLQ